MKKRSLSLGCVCLLLAAAGAHAATPDPASAYLSVKQSIRQGVMPQAELGQILMSPASYKGRAIEVTADILGAISSGTSRTILCTVAGTSMSLTLPASLSGQDWAQTGHELRMLLSVDDPSGQDPGSAFRIITAAPEYDVAQEESTVPVGWTRLNTSRSLAYVRDVGPSASTPVAGAGVPSDPTNPNYYYSDAGHPTADLSAGARVVFPIYRNQISELNAHLTDTELDTITSCLLKYSEYNGIDPRLMMAMIIAESGFDIHSTSRTGAMGLGQLMPETAAGLSVTDPYDIEQNIAASAHILRGRLDQYGGAPANGGEIPSDQLKLVMAAYNAGPGAVAKYHGVPPYEETQHYVAKVESLYRAMCAGD